MWTYSSLVVDALTTFRNGFTVGFHVSLWMNVLGYRTSY